MEMRKITAITALLITALILAGCANVDITVKTDTVAPEQDNITVIGGSDCPASIYLAPDTDKEEDRNGADEFLAGTWTTASQGYEYYGISQAMYYVRFDGNDIIYGHYKDREFVPDHTDKVTLIEPVPEGGYIIKAETEDGDKYTYRSAESDLDLLEHYSTWNEDEFSDHYHGGSSLSRMTDGNIPDHKAGIGVNKAYKSDFGTYYELDDGTWLYDGKHYKYRLEITGRMNNAAKDSTFIYLSNIEDIPFDRAVMASGLSSNMADYFSPEEAVFVGWSE
jgi:hypothetical protein